MKTKIYWVMRKEKFGTFQIGAVEARSESEAIKLAYKEYHCGSDEHLIIEEARSQQSNKVGTSV